MDQENKLEEFMFQDRIDRLKEIARQRSKNLVVVADGVHDPHNLSAVVRSCEGFGLLNLYVIETHARFRIRSKVTQGAEKWLDIHRHKKPEDCIKALKDQQFDIWIADPSSGSVCVDDLPWKNKLALIFGNEHEGASAKMYQAATGRFHIPMHGFTQSFNISVASAICLAIAVRGRIRELGRHEDLLPEEQQSLVQEWQKRSVRGADKILARVRQPLKEEDTDFEPWK
jgi:tRNA (guanosine-2'-O-)-methyltransferase